MKLPIKNFKEFIPKHEEYIRSSIIFFPDCDFNCKFCIYRNCHDMTTIEDREVILKKAIKLVSDPKLKPTPILSLVGGEFFGTKLKGLEDLWLELMTVCYNSGFELIQVQTSLMFKEMPLLDKTAEILKEKLSVATSYNEEGRFSNTRKSNWRKHLDHYKSIGANVYIIYTLSQNFIDKLYNHEVSFEPDTDRLFRLPTIPYGEDCIYNNSDEYYEYVKRNIDKYPENFFISDREKLISVIKEYDEMTPRAFFASIYFERSFILHKYPDIYYNHVFNECGHSILGMNYFNEEHDCILCDIEEAFKEEVE